MPNEQINNIAAQGQVAPAENQGGTSTPAPAPTDLAEAFAALREADTKATEGSVDDPEPVRGKHAKETEAVEEGTEEAEPKHDDTPTSDEGAQQEPSADVGGNATDDEPVDYSPAREQIFQGINQQAVQNVAQRFRENGIRMWEIGDLYDKDEQSGRVTFKNPDDENRPFQSRKEAQDFVDAMNRQINMKFQSEVRQEQQKLYNDAKPSLSMIDFVPVYQQLSDVERGVFDDLITPYAIRDASGNIQGFNVDLMAAANQARNIAARFAAPEKKEEPEKEKTEATSPAVDIKSGTGDVADDEPTNLSEAFEKLNKMKKEDKKNG